MLIIVIACVFIFFKSNNGLLRIANFDEYYYGVPKKTQDIIASMLKSTVGKNTAGNPPSDGALIRGVEPYLYYYNENTGEYSGEFIVDIPDIQQSYLVKFNYSSNPDEFMGGYAALVYCLPDDKMIYPDFGCQNDLPFITEDN